MTHIMSPLDSNRRIVGYRTSLGQVNRETPAWVKPGFRVYQYGSLMEDGGSGRSKFRSTRTRTDQPRNEEAMFTFCAVVRVRSEHIVASNASFANTDSLDQSHCPPACCERVVTDGTLPIRCSGSGKWISASMPLSYYREILSLLHCRLGSG